MSFSVRAVLLVLVPLGVGCTTRPDWQNGAGDGAISTTDGSGADLGQTPDYGSWPDAEVGPPVSVSVATFNVRNLFDTVDDPSTFDDLPTAGEVDAKIQALGAALRRLDADVLALQEVENRALLERLNSEELTGQGYAHLRLVEGNDARGADVALLSRHPVPRSISHARETFPGVDGDTQNYGFSRDCLEVTIEPSPGRSLVLLINHLRANDWRDPEEAVARRLAQAQRVRGIVDELLGREPEANLAVIGDLNDVPGSRTLQLITQGQPQLVDVVAAVPAEQRYTHVYQGEKQQLDHLLVAPGLLGDLESGSVTIDHDSTYSAASDHFPVFARFTVN